MWELAEQRFRDVASTGSDKYYEKVKTELRQKYGTDAVDKHRLKEIARASPAHAREDLRVRSNSLFSTDPDKAHDKTIAGLEIHADITALKVALRKLRDAIDATARMYTKYNDETKNKKAAFALVLGELAAWTQHDTFFGSEGAAAAIFRDASQLAALEKLAREARAAIVDGGVGGLKAATKVVGDALQEVHPPPPRLHLHLLHLLHLLQVYGYELLVRKGVAAQAAASKALTKASGAATAAAAAATKAENPFNNDPKQAAAAAEAVAAKTRADMAESEAKDALAPAEAERSEERRGGQECGTGGGV